MNNWGWYINYISLHSVVLVPPRTSTQLSIGVLVTTQNTK